jgi:hypothetical protein
VGEWDGEEVLEGDVGGGKKMAIGPWRRGRKRLAAEIEVSTSHRREKDDNNNYHRGIKERVCSILQPPR